MFCPSTSTHTHTHTYHPLTSMWLTWLNKGFIIDFQSDRYPSPVQWCNWLKRSNPPILHIKVTLFVTESSTQPVKTAVWCLSWFWWGVLTSEKISRMECECWWCGVKFEIKYWVAIWELYDPEFLKLDSTQPVLRFWAASFTEGQY